MRHRKSLEDKVSEKTSEFRSKSSVSHLVLIHSFIRIDSRQQLVPNQKKSSLLSRNTTKVRSRAKTVKYYSSFSEVDLEPISPILAAPTYHSQSYPSRKRTAQSCFLSKVIRASF
ncbi:Hypothetical_protein [Hexamita inflata]|uniref:Hypothetical_protein n=1 Tax=Hexamita inflata TaxID=28002 RepID=A0ABP1KJ76_9EUKA